MYKKVFFSLSLLSSLYASDKYTMYASQVESFVDKVYANGSVVIYHDGSVYRSNKAVYDKSKKLLKLLGDVTIVKKDSIINSKNIELKLNSKKIAGDKFFIYDSVNGLWIRGSRYYKKSKDIQIVRDSEVSSCNVQNPEWKILFSKAKYDKKINFISLYKPTFYFKGKPVFGLPFFAFPTVDDRTTGLLRPEFGFNVDSGFTFMQPYFYAPKRNWDLEFVPQIRTKRGYGLYTTLSFADTKYSRGKFTIGSFKDKSSFYHDKNLKNSSHYGFDFSYKSTRVFDKYYKKDSDKDGLWIDLHYLNDIDYENLKDVKIKSFNKLVTSRINYFFKRDRDYFGIYAKYFIDTDKENNNDTLQELPTLQYHKFTTSLPFKNLIYSVDYKVKNNYRKEGLNATMHEISLPITLNIPLFHNYLNFSFSENLYYTKINYDKKNINIEDAKYFSNYHKFILSSDLTKPYDNFVHNLQLEASLQVPSFEDKSGDIADFININKEKKNLKLSANQYFYNNQNFNFLTLRTRELIYLNEDKKRYGDIFNEIIYRYSTNFTIIENIDYSTKYNKIKKIQSTLNYHDDFYRLSLSHTYQNVPGERKINYLTTNFKFSLLGGYDIETSLDYDLESDFTRSWSTKLFKNKGCWDYSIRYKESLTPIFTSAGIKSYKNRGLYFLVNFANIGGVSYEFSDEEVSDTGVNDE
jgi:LPS-assembly protein